MLLLASAGGLTLDQRTNWSAAIRVQKQPPSQQQDARHWRRSKHTASIPDDSLQTSLSQLQPCILQAQGVATLPVAAERISLVDVVLQGACRCAALRVHAAALDLDGQLHLEQAVVVGAA